MITLEEENVAERKCRENRETFFTTFKQIVARIKSCKNFKINWIELNWTSLFQGGTSWREKYTVYSFQSDGVPRST